MEGDDPSQLAGLAEETKFSCKLARSDVDLQDLSLRDLCLQDLRAPWAEGCNLGALACRPLASQSGAGSTYEGKGITGQRHTAWRYSAAENEGLLLGSAEGASNECSELCCFPVLFFLPSSPDNTECNLDLTDVIKVQQPLLPAEPRRATLDCYKVQRIAVAGVAWPASARLDTARLGSTARPGETAQPALGINAC